MAINANLNNISVIPQQRSNGQFIGGGTGSPREEKTTDLSQVTEASP